MVYNVLSCSGFLESVSTGINFGPCFSARLGFVLLFFIIAIIRKWGGEEMGLDFNFLISLVLAFLAYFIIVSITGNFKISFVIGLIAALVGGYGSGFLGFGGEGGDGYG